MTPRVRTMAITIASIAMALLGYEAGRIDRSTRSTDATTHSHSAPMASASASAVAPIPSTARSSSDAGASTRDRYADLVRRGATDGAAAAELAQWLQTCAERSFEERSLSQLRARLDPDVRNGRPISADAQRVFAQQIARSEAEAAARQNACDGITPDKMATRGEWLYRAAKLGDVDSALAFGSGRFLYADLMNQLDEIAFWRDHAEEALTIALEGGTPWAARELAMAYDPAPMMTEGGPRFAPDAERAYSYYAVLLLCHDEGSGTMYEESLERLAAQLDEEQIAAANALAATICANDLPGQCDGAHAQ
jgi:hypothetical protein